MSATDTQPPGSTSRTQSRRAFTAALTGTAFEYYDFVIYGAAAALVFGPQFFPNEDPTLSLLAAFSTFAVGFLSRPLGGIIAGHFGDRIGRKTILVITLLTMGIATILIGCVPTYAQIGIAAPIILVVLRLVQGLAVGAEWGGAALMAVEQAPSRRRSLFGSAPAIGVPAGSVLANVVLLVLSALTGPGFTEWGWRIAFIGSVVLVVIGLIVRTRLEETKDFSRAEKRHVERVPLLSVLRRFPLSVVLTLFGNISGAAIGYLVLTYSLAYGTTADVGFSRDEMLAIIIVTGTIWTLAMPFMGFFADRWGRRRVMLVGIAVQLIAVLAFFPLFNTGQFGLAIAACVFVLLSNAASYAPAPAMYSDIFPTNLRYTGMSLGFQLGGILGGGLMPVIATAIFQSTGNSMLIGGYIAVLTLLTGVSVVASHSRRVLDRAAAADARPTP
jgi:MFS family permease